MNWNDWILQKNAEFILDKLGVSREEMIEYLEKKVREEDWSSDNTDPSINPSLGGKYGKVHGGDPRKALRGEESGIMSDVHGDKLVEVKDGKYRKRISGASNLRTKNEAGRALEKAFNDDEDDKRSPAKQEGFKIGNVRGKRVGGAAIRDKNLHEMQPDEKMELAEKLGRKKFKKLNKSARE